MEADVTVKRWGDSLAVIIPKKLAEKERLRVKDSIHIKFDKEADLSDLFGLLKGRLKKSPQQLKNLARSGWR